MTTSSLSQYICPYNSAESERLDLQHQIFTRVFAGQLYLCPYQPKKDSRILDVGSGTGSWVLDCAAMHSEASVVGFDIHPALKSSQHPGMFACGNFEDPWDQIVPHQYDLIHARLLFASIRSLYHFVSQAERRLSRGGFLELQDIAFPFQHLPSPHATRIDTWCQHMQEAAQRRGLDLRLPYRYADSLQRAGLNPVCEKRGYSIPIGMWPSQPRERELGRMNRENVLAGLDHFSRILLMQDSVLNLQEDQYQAILAAARADLHNDALELRIPVVVVWGRKPEPKLVAQTTKDEEDEEHIEPLVL